MEVRSLQQFFAIAGVSVSTQSYSASFQSFRFPLSVVIPIQRRRIERLDRSDFEMCRARSAFSLFLSLSLSLSLSLPLSFYIHIYIAGIVSGECEHTMHGWIWYHANGRHSQTRTAIGIVTTRGNAVFLRYFDVVAASGWLTHATNRFAKLHGFPSARARPLAVSARRIYRPADFHAGNDSSTRYSRVYVYLIARRSSIRVHSIQSRDWIIHGQFKPKEESVTQRVHWIVTNDTRLVLSSPCLEVESYPSAIKPKTKCTSVIPL